MSCFWSTEWVRDYPEFLITCCHSRTLRSCAMKWYNLLRHLFITNSFRIVIKTISTVAFLFLRCFWSTECVEIILNFRSRVVTIGRTVYNMLTHLFITNLFSNRDKNYFNCCSIFLWVVFEAPNGSEIILNFWSLVVTVGLCEVARWNGTTCSDQWRICPGHEPDEWTWTRVRVRSEILRVSGSDFVSSNNMCPSHFQKQSVSGSKCVRVVSNPKCVTGPQTFHCKLVFESW